MTPQLFVLGIVAPRFARLVLDRRFLARHLEQLLNRLVECFGQLLFPFADLLLACLLHVARGLIHLLRRVPSVLLPHVFFRCRRVLLRGCRLLRACRRPVPLQATLQLLHILRETLRPVCELRRALLLAVGRHATRRIRQCRRS